MPPPQRAKPARKSARFGVGDGSQRPHPPHPPPVGSGFRPHARRDEWLGVGKRPTPDAPHLNRWSPPRAPSCRPHSAQSQLTKARAVGLVTGPDVRIPRTHSQCVVDPGCTPEGTSGRGWESARPRTPSKRRPPPGALVPPQQCAKPARKSARCGVGDGSPGPHPPHPQPVGSGPRPHARKDEWSGVGKRPTPDAPHPGKRSPPPGSLMPPPQRAKPAHKSARCGVGDGSRCSQPPHPQPVCSGPRLRARRDEWSGLGERPTPDAQQEAPPPGRPGAAPTMRKASSQERAMWGW